MYEKPKETIKAILSFKKSFDEMLKKNVIGGNIPAHRKANKDATLKADAQTAAAISALREQYKNIRVNPNHPDGSIYAVTPGRRRKETPP